MKRFHFFLFLYFASVAMGAYAQEICNNGVDDDNDGRIDCFDSDCSNNTLCDGSFIGNDAVCDVRPDQFPAFRMKLAWQSPNQTTTHLNRISIGDLDNDGIPEVVATNNENDRIYVLNGADGSIKYSTGQAGRVNINYELARDVAIANIPPLPFVSTNVDNCAEIFVSGTVNGNWYIFAYNCDLTQLLWQSDANPSVNGNQALEGDPGPLGIADFNGDRVVELYFRDIVYNAHTGKQIANSPLSFNESGVTPVAVDILDNQDLELISGLRVFSVNIASGTMTLLSSRADYFTKSGLSEGDYVASHTSVADYNLDGNLDIIASGSDTDGGGDWKKRNTTVFFWDLTNNVLRKYQNFIDSTFTIIGCNNGSTSTSTGKYYLRGWERGTGRINIGDLDGDGQLNVAYVSGKFLYALREDFTLLWRKTVKEETSGFTGCTMFDFNGDGSTEIVYRDEANLMIIDGATKNTLTFQTCISRTNIEYPIVADVNADGQSEICVTCGFNDGQANANFCNTSFSVNSHVRAFQTDLEPWVPARRLWNQHAYFNVNVNDDLTIPRRQQKQQTIFSATGCDGNNRPTRPLNSFLNQSPYLNSLGCPIYAAPNLEYVNASVLITQPTCPDRDFGITFRVRNVGDIPLNGKVPVAFYKGNPIAAGAVKIDTISINFSRFNVNADTLITTTVTGDGSAFTLYVALNHTGTQAPPITFPDPLSTFKECNYTNIFEAQVNPSPAPLTALKVADNIKCANSNTPDNGAVRAYVPVGGTENTTDYTFYWSNGGVALPIPANFTGAVYNQRDAGQYTVFARHNTALCNTVTRTETVNRVIRNLDAIITQENPYNNCGNPNGRLRVTVQENGVNQPAGNFTYQWFRSNLALTPPSIGISDVLTGLVPGPYTVLVIDNVTGCQAIESFTIIDESVRPVPTTSITNILCSSANSGSVSATVGGATAGFTFRWYNGSTVKPTADFTGPNYTNRPAGTYTLVVSRNTTQCTDTARVTVTQSTPITVTASATAPMTSCVATMPNGSAAASVGGVTAGFEFEWFTGQNTLVANRIAQTPAISNRPAGVYTVRATNTVTRCSDTEEVTIAFNVVTPTLAAGAIVGNTSCGTPTGSFTAIVTPGPASNYTFQWFNGPAVKAASDYPADTDDVLNNLNAGVYTVRALHRTNNCVTQPITRTIVDNTPSITMTRSAFTPPNDCNSPTGFMTVTISSTPPNLGGFTVSWFKDSTPVPPVETGVSISTRGSLTTGNYTVRALDPISGCSQDSTLFLPYVGAPEIYLSLKRDPNRCNDNSNSLFEVRLDPDPDPVTNNRFKNDFDLYFYTGINATGIPDLSNQPGSSGTDVSPPPNNALFSVSSMAPGFYSAVAFDNTLSTPGAPCFSNIVTVEILPFLGDPEVTLTPTNNTVCSPGIPPFNAPFNGRITSSIAVNAATGNTGVLNDYNFVWTNVSGSAAGLPPNGTGDITIGVGADEYLALPAGKYDVRVENQATGCFTVSSADVFDNLPIVQGTVATTPLTRCDVLNGSAQFTDVTENGIDATAGYTFFNWAKVNASGSITTSLPSANPQTALDSGIYVVDARSSVNNCATTLRFDIQDNRLFPTVTLVDFDNPTECFKDPVTRTDTPGRLDVSASGGVTPYTFDWFEGTNITAPAPAPPVTISGTLTTSVVDGIEILPPQTSAAYTIRVRGTNGCATTDTYNIQLDERPILLSASATPFLTSCLFNNTEAYAIVTSNAFPNDYEYHWVQGNVERVPGDSIRSTIRGLGIGQPFTVVAVDPLEPNCISQPVTVVVEDGRVFPTVNAMQMAPLTICDVTRPNGVAAASVINSDNSIDIVNYTFDWYAGNAVVPSAFVYTGVQAGALSSGLHTVEATHNITGCRGDTTVTIGENKLPIPDPQVTVLSHVTTCDPFQNNGALSASVGGNTTDYIFDWSDGTTVRTPPDFIGDIYDSLDVGIYTVVATSRITGCVSGPAPGEIIEEQVLPDFDFEVTKATCDQQNGFVAIQIMNNIVISSIEWNINGTLFYGPLLEGIGEGVYPVTVTTTEGCTFTKEVAVGTEIRPFNGISRNGDDQNSLFEIDCIESFPSNVVKIFNRAGTLVYQASGYDNLQTYFDGQSNKGISPLGNNLPDGTYFYIIDKGDGSKPLAGYLEIVK